MMVSRNHGPRFTGSKLSSPFLRADLKRFDHEPRTKRRQQPGSHQRGRRRRPSVRPPAVIAGCGAGWTPWAPASCRPRTSCRGHRRRRRPAGAASCRRRRRRRTRSAAGASRGGDTAGPGRAPVARPRRRWRWLCCSASAAARSRSGETMPLLPARRGR